MGQKRKITLVKSNERQSANIGKHFFNVGVPKVVHFTDEEMKKFVEPSIEFIKLHFKVEPFEGEIKEGESFDFGTSLEKKSEKTLKQILEDGNPKELVSFIEKNGKDSVKKTVLEQVLDSLKVKFDKDSDLIELLKKAS